MKATSRGSPAGDPPPSNVSVSAGEVVTCTFTNHKPGHIVIVKDAQPNDAQDFTFTSTGSDDDLAIMLADTNDASVIVHVGAPPTLTDFLERAPSEGARMFVARLRAGSKLVDAKSVAEFSAKPMSAWPLVLLLLAGVLAVVVAITVTPTGQDWVDQLTDAVSDLGSSIEGIFS